MKKKPKTKLPERAVYEKAMQRGFSLRKWRGLDPREPGYGTYGISKTTIEYGDSSGYGKSLEDCDEYLSKVFVPKHKRFIHPNMIIDEFTHLPVSRQRKEALRAVKRGLCLQCKRRPIATSRSSQRCEVCLQKISNERIARRKKQTISHLKEHHPDLYKQVMAGELSTHSAGIKAGWRKPWRALYPKF